MERIRTLAIMQPYLFPYIGYYQLMNAVDEFVVYDNIEFTKKGWINRNRILVNGKDEYITFPLKKASDYSFIKQRELAESWTAERSKLLNKIRESYRKAPYFIDAYPLIEKAVSYDDNNLFNFIFHSLEVVRLYLNITTPLIVSSTLGINHHLKGAEKVKAICKERQATTYINPIGGVDLYDKREFDAEEIKLRFLKTSGVNYSQFKNHFVPYLSIIDVMMFNSQEKLQQFLQFSYELF